jgi:hypothetical protein
MIRRTLITAVFGLLAVGAHAEIVTTNIVLSVSPNPVIGTNRFTVPAGKILAIEHIKLSNTNHYIYIFEQVNAGGFLNEILTGVQGITSFSPSLKITGPRTLQVGPGGAIAMIYGLLVDPSDIYAAVPGEFESVRGLANGSMGATLRMDSPRPVHIQLETSSGDPAAWTPLAGVDLRREEEADRIDVADIPPGDPVTLLRAKIRARTYD